MSAKTSESEEIVYFPVKIRLHDIDYFSLWYSNDDFDGLLLSGDKIMCFQSLESSLAYAQDMKLAIDSSAPTEWNFDLVEQWACDPDALTVDCKLLLNAWNHIWDVDSTINQKNMKERVNKFGSIYEKLFAGNNLPSITPVGHRYEPIWNTSEIEKLKTIMKEGVQLIAKHIEHAKC